MVGEFDLIKRLQGLVPGTGAGVLEGIGDDCALVEADGKLLLITGDSQIEKRHFLREKTEPELLGEKLVEINVSDIASCGGSPLWGFLFLTVPEKIEPGFIEAVYRGIGRACKRHGVAVVGGNTSAADVLGLEMAMIGETKKFIPRAGAKPGDLLFLSGPAGTARAGLEKILAGEADEADPLVRAHRLPSARTDLVPALEALATAAVDISDGLAGDAGHLAEASGVQLEIDASLLPLAPELAAYCESRSTDPLEYLLYGGEEYQLLATGPEALESEGFVRIGRVVSGEGVFLNENGSLRRINQKGFDHLN